MDVLNSRTLQNRTPAFFNMKDLNAAGVARIEQSVKAARETLALADRLQSMRDTTKTLWKLESSLKSTSSRRALDITL